MKSGLWRRQPNANFTVNADFCSCHMSLKLGGQKTEFGLGGIFFCLRTFPCCPSPVL